MRLLDKYAPRILQISRQLWTSGFCIDVSVNTHIYFNLNRKKVKYDSFRIISTIILTAFSTKLPCKDWGRFLMRSYRQIKIVFEFGRIGSA